MKNWNKIFEALPDEEQDKLALLRLVECTNGVIQHSFRNGDADALSPEETRAAMKFSMSAMKTQTIPLGDEVVIFAPETAKIMSEVRELYISGFKQQNQEDYEEFMMHLLQILVQSVKKEYSRPEQYFLITYMKYPITH